MSWPIASWVGLRRPEGQAHARERSTAAWGASGAGGRRSAAPGKASGAGWKLPRRRACPFSRGKTRSAGAREASSGEEGTNLPGKTRWGRRRKLPDGDGSFRAETEALGKGADRGLCCRSPHPTSPSSRASRGGSSSGKGVTGPRSARADRRYRSGWPRLACDVCSRSRTCSCGLGVSTSWRLNSRG
jgi:hypothetical protein